MIAALAIYALLVGLLLGVLAVLVERGVRLVGGPTRLVWAVAMSAMVVFPAAALLMREQPIAPAPTVLRGGDVASPGGSVGMSLIRDDKALVVSTAPERLTNRWRELLNRIHDGAAGYDGLLLALWAVVSAFLLGMMLHALSEARRMRLGLKSETVCGTTVLVSEEIGPAAMGGSPRAIVIPRWVMALDDSLRSLVIRHEQEHLATRDPAMLTTALCTLVLMPWHPVLWWSWRRLRLAIECDCDARVLRREPNPKKYGQLLLLVSHHRSTARRGQRLLMSLAAPLSPQASQLKQRIDAMTTPPTRHKRSTIAALTAAVFGAALLIAAVPAPRSNRVKMAGSPLEYRWVARQAVGAGISVLPRRTDGDSAAVSVSEPFLTLADVDSIMVTGTDNGEATVGAMVSAAARDRLRATTRQHIGSEVAVVVDGAVVTVATVKSELEGPLPIWMGAAAEASAVAVRLREAQQQGPELRQGGSAPLGSLSAARTSLPGQSSNVTVYATKVGTKNVAVDGRGQIAGEILIYGAGPVKVGLGTAEPQVVADTIRLKSFPAFIADVTNGDVHVELRGEGELEFAATVTGGSASRVSATGQHFVLLKGGTGIKTVGRK